MINIFICDDEESYIEILSYKIKKCISQHLNMECCITGFASADKLYEGIKESKPDIIFLDVMVNDSNTIEWLIEHQKDFRNVPVVIMTAFPFEISRISDVDFCYFMIKSKMSDDQLLRAITRSVAAVTKKDTDLETVSFGNKTYTINFQDIMYIETVRNNIIIHSVNGECLTLYTPLKKFAEKLPPNFLRCHKCYMVNMNFIHSSEPHCLILLNGISIPVSPKNYKSVVNSYRQYLLNI